MSVAVLHRDDALPGLSPLCGLHVAEERNAPYMARLMSLDTQIIEARFAAGHRAYVATFDGDFAAWGWVATRHAKIGELNLEFDVPAGERYLWNFVTRPALRGRGIYPRFLQEIVRRESADAERFWIVYAPENHASERGVTTAGFQPVADLSFDATGAVRVSGEAPIFGAPQAGDALTPCWKCARAGKQWLMKCAPGACQCDYQKPLIACHEGTTLSV